MDSCQPREVRRNVKMEMDKAYDAVVSYTYYHCGTCTGHRTSSRVKVHDFKTVEEAKEQAKDLIRQQYPGMVIDFEKVILQQYSVL